MVKGDGKMGVYDGSGEGRVFSEGWEGVELMAVDWDVDREDRGDFYYRWR